MFYNTSKPFLYWIEDSIIGKYFYLRNTEHIGNILKYQYDVEKRGKGKKQE